MEVCLSQQPAKHEYERWNKSESSSENGKHSQARNYLVCLPVQPRVKANFLTPTNKFHRRHVKGDTLSEEMCFAACLPYRGVVGVEGSIPSSSGTRELCHRWFCYSQILHHPQVMTTTTSSKLLSSSRMLYR